MMRFDRLVTVVLFAALVGGGHSVAQAKEANENSEVAARAAAGAINAFSMDVYAALRSRTGNLFLSPYSISTALAMTYAGARGTTADEMAKVLHYDVDQAKLHAAFGQLLETTKAGKGYELSVANALWGQKGFQYLKEYLALVADHYGAGLSELDFVSNAEGARKTINTWVEKKTRKKIKDLIQRGVLGPATRLVLTNAIYFKGKWSSQFKEQATRDAPFHLAGGNTADVPMMTQKAKCGYAETDDLQVLEMPYEGEELSMVVLLPKATDGLPAFEKTLTQAKLDAWLAALRPREVVVFLPKFKMTSQFELSETLGSMGMPLAFSPAADFSGMTGKRDLMISNVIHKAFVDVNEEGTEAAAATAVVVGLTSAAPTPVTIFRADHPFVFLIRDRRSDSILFIGRVANPKA